ncbi:hypothetical protein ACIRPK_27725 [Kitasatospora sp. NPDC101801]|uniref:hypothetical protein n=1 Tax=Kitasatospora sp. NPDC101801 TaxID=3364103 RepID=UPI0038187DD7
MVGEVVTIAEQQGWPVLAFRMDEVEAEDRTAEAVGRRLDLPASPAALITRVARGGPALLVVDQLDAASSYSGRMPDVFEAVDDMLELLAAAPNVRVVLAARTVDVEKDPRLTSLVGQESTTARFRLDLLEDQAVSAVLEAGGTSPDTLGAKTLELLRTPLHLAVFSRLSSEAQTTPYRSLQELYARYTEERRREIERSLPSDAWPDVTGRLIDEMSRREAVTIPYAFLDRFARADLAVLISAGVLVHADSDRIGFFHETYFDYLFARSFVGSGHDLHDFLATSGQALFRRAQTRQVLEHLSRTDRAEFRRTVVRLLESDAVRPHLHFIVLAVLEDLDPTGEDWAALDRLAWGEGVTAEQLRQLLARPGWFDAVDTGRWEQWLADPRMVPLVFQQLEWCTQHRPVRVLELFEPYAEADDSWRQRILSWACTWPTSHSADLIRRLVERGDFDDEQYGPSERAIDFWQLFENLADHDAPCAIQVLGQFLDRGLRRTLAAGWSDPFDSGYLSSPAASWVSACVTETATAAPQAVLDHILPFVISVVEASRAADPCADPPVSRWSHPPSPFQPELDGALYTAAHDALRTRAAQEPAAVADVMELLSAGRGWALDYLSCRTFTVWNRPDEAIAWLMAAGGRLRLGWPDSPHSASRELISAATQSCQEQSVEQLSDLLLRHYPDRECSPAHRDLFGRSQYVLLEAVAEHRRSPAVARRLAELKRKFGQDPLRGPRPVEAAWVGPPIAPSAGSHMTDAHWLKALKKYTADSVDWDGEHPRGGARELASLLKEATRRQPDRFTRLGCTFDRNVPAAAFAAVIDGAVGRAKVDGLLALCSHARRLVGVQVGRTVCRAILGAAQDAVTHPAALPLLTACAGDPDPAAEVAWTGSQHGKYYGGDLLTAGMNSTRGEAALALGALLRAAEAPAEELLPLLGLLIRDPIMAVRVCAADAVVAALRHDRAAALDLTELLFAGTPVAVHEARTTHELLMLALLYDTERFAPELTRALDGPEGTARYAGATWAALALRERLVPGLPESVSGLSCSARRGAAEVAANDPARSRLLLRALFHDDDREVRKVAAGALRAMTSLPTDASDDLIDSFLPSQAFAEHPDALAAPLARSTLRLPTRTLDACRKLASAAEHGRTGGKRGNALLQQHLIETVLRLYRQGSTGTRSQCLDIIDSLYRVNAHGLSKALSEER